MEPADGQCGYSRHVGMKSEVLCCDYEADGRRPVLPANWNRGSHRCYQGGESRCQAPSLSRSNRPFRGRFFVELFDFCNSVVVIPAIEKEDVASAYGGDQGIVILREIGRASCRERGENSVVAGL